MKAILPRFENEKSGATASSMALSPRRIARGSGDPAAVRINLVASSYPDELMQLQEADRLIAVGREGIANQKRRIAELQKSGHTAAGYIAVLYELERSLRLTTNHRAGIARPACRES